MRQTTGNGIICQRGLYGGFDVRFYHMMVKNLFLNRLKQRPFHHTATFLWGKTFNTCLT